MRIGIIGVGQIGGNAARLLARAGHEVLLSFSRDADRLPALAAETGACTGTPREAVGFGEVVFLSVPWPVLDDVIAQAGPLDGKIVIDSTNQFGGEGWENLGLRTAAERYGEVEGTITALREFETKYKAHLALVPELAAARVAYLAGVLDHFQKAAKPSKDLWLLARRLVVYADKHPDAKVALRFSQQESHTLEKNEHMLGASAYYGGDKTLPSHFLLGESARSGERRAGAELSAALDRVFPNDLLRFEAGAPVPAGPTPHFDEPTIFVSYRFEISSPLVSKKPRGIYSAVGLVATTALTIPDQEPAQESKYTAWHAPDVKRVEAGELLPENVYNDLVARAWSKFTAKYTAPWLGAEAK